MAVSVHGLHSDLIVGLELLLALLVDLGVISLLLLHLDCIMCLISRLEVGG